jgi:Putative zinc- or iron-chelating domain
METETFACSECGNCCSTWQVAIDKPRANALFALPWVEERLHALGLAFEPLLDWGYYLPLKPDQMCVFWEQNEGCLIHKNVGATAKPLDCQRFPFASFTPETTANTTFTDVSFACSEMVNTHLLQWETPTPSLVESVGLEAVTQSPQSVSPFYPKGVVWQPSVAIWSWPFKWFKPLPWAVLDHRLTLMKPAFQDDSISVWGALALAFTVMCSPIYKVWYAEQLLAFSLQFKRRERPRQSVLWQLFQRWVLAKFVRMPYGMFDVVRFVFRGRYADDKVLGLASEVPVGAVLGLPSSESRYVKAFLFQVLNRRLPLGYGGAWVELWLQACVAWFLVQWYGRILAVMGGQSVVDEPSVKSAIRLVERYYTAHQPRFLSKFEGQWFWLLLFRLFLRV